MTFQQVVQVSDLTQAQGLFGQGHWSAVGFMLETTGFELEAVPSERPVMSLLEFAVLGGNDTTVRDLVIAWSGADAVAYHLDKLSNMLINALRHDNCAALLNALALQPLYKEGMRKLLTQTGEPKQRFDARMLYKGDRALDLFIDDLMTPPPQAAVLLDTPPRANSRRGADEVDVVGTTPERTRTNNAAINAAQVGLFGDTHKRSLENGFETEPKRHLTFWNHEPDGIEEIQVNPAEQMHTGMAGQQPPSLPRYLPN